ncbi:hypothetical protein [Streptomyces sp. NPDC088736]|uniref:hypothetical protein n=1 Tax=Streptomyces sp. NPDC088736 TaxID=3365881 RepID=UPI0038119713
MAHRPYPSRDRALHQIDRHIDEIGPMIGGRPHAVTPFGQRLIDATDTAVQALGRSLAASMKNMQPSVDTYRLSSR